MLILYRFQKDSAKVRNIFELAKNTATCATFAQFTDTQCQDIVRKPLTHLPHIHFIGINLYTY